MDNLCNDFFRNRMFFPVLVNGEEVCTRKEAMGAEKNASNIRTWAEYYESYKKFGHCDDGSIAEGYSWSTMKLLKDNWDKIHEFKELSKDMDFQKFVYLHINETYSEEELNGIKVNCQKKCPVKHTTICKEIENIVINILNE